jgi:hypothetical protein
VIWTSADELCGPQPVTCTSTAAFIVPVSEASADGSIVIVGVPCPLAMAAPVSCQLNAAPGAGFVNVAENLSGWLIFEIVFADGNTVTSGQPCASAPEYKNIATTHDENMTSFLISRLFAFAYEITS